jgi:hypothetical protein
VTPRGFGPHQRRQRVHALTAAAADQRDPDLILAAVGAVDRCGLNIKQAAGLLGVSVERCRSLLAAGRRRERPR